MLARKSLLPLGNRSLTSFHLLLHVPRLNVANLIVSARGELQVNHVLPQLPPNDVDLHGSFRDGLRLPGFQVLHFPQYSCQLGASGESREMTKSKKL